MVYGRRFEAAVLRLERLRITSFSTVILSVLASIDSCRGISSPHGRLPAAPPSPKSSDSHFDLKGYSRTGPSSWHLMIYPFYYRWTSLLRKNLMTTTVDFVLLNGIGWDGIYDSRTCLKALHLVSVIKLTIL